jgi:peptidyl-prolyl cis-trans isomerase C
MAEVALRERMARGAANNPQTLAAVRDGLIDQALMAKAGTRAGLDKDPLVEAQVELLRQRLLAQAWQRKVLADLKPGEKELRAEWARLNEERGKREVRIRHLLVREEPTAKLLVDRVQSGTPMAQLAAEYSLDEGSKGEGGLAAWAPEGLLIPGLADAVKGLKKGQLAASPVQTPAGWHVLQLEDVRALDPTDFDQVRPQLLQRLGAKAVQAQLGKMRDAAKVQ